MFSLDRHSLEKFVEKPDDFVLRKQDGMIFAEKKGAWTWIKSHVFDRQSYNLQKIVPYLRGRDDISQKLQETVDKKIELFNQKYESTGRKIVPLKNIQDTSLKVAKAPKGRVFMGEQQTLLFDVNAAPINIASQKPQYQELKEDRGFNPHDGKIGKLPTTTTRDLQYRFKKGKMVNEKQMVDAFDKDCILFLFKLAGKSKKDPQEIRSVIAPAISLAFSHALFAFSSGDKKWDFESFRTEVLSNLKAMLEKPTDEDHRSINTAFVSYLKQTQWDVSPKELVTLMITRHKDLLNLFFAQNR